MKLHPMLAAAALLGGVALCTWSCTAPERRRSRPLLSPPLATEPALVEELVASWPEQRPDWTQSGTTELAGGDRAFTGVSRPQATEQEARRDALRDAREEIASYLSSDAHRALDEERRRRGGTVEAGTTPGAGGAAAASSGVLAEVLAAMATPALLDTAATDYYVEKWLERDAGKERIVWKAWARVPFAAEQTRELRDSNVRAAVQRQIDRLEVSLAALDPEAASPARLRDLEQRLAAARESLRAGEPLAAAAELDAIGSGLALAQAGLRRKQFPPPEREPPEPSSLTSTGARRSGAAPRGSAAVPAAASAAEAAATQRTDRVARVLAEIGGALRQAADDLAHGAPLAARVRLVQTRQRLAAAADELQSVALRSQQRRIDEFLQATVPGAPGVTTAGTLASLRELQAELRTR